VLCLHFHRANVPLIANISERCAAVIGTMTTDQGGISGCVSFTFGRDFPCLASARLSRFFQIFWESAFRHVRDTSRVPVVAARRCPRIIPAYRRLEDGAAVYEVQLGCRRW
jgi:hypothetical protein